MIANVDHIESPYRLQKGNDRLCKDGPSCRIGTDVTESRLRFRSWIGKGPSPDGNQGMQRFKVNILQCVKAIVQWHLVGIIVIPRSQMIVIINPSKRICQMRISTTHHINIQR